MEGVPQDKQVTVWYVVVEVEISNCDSHYLVYRGVAAMTTNRQEALDKEKELDRKYMRMGLIELMEVANA